MNRLLIILLFVSVPAAVSAQSKDTEVIRLLDSADSNESRNMNRQAYKFAKQALDRLQKLPGNNKEQIAVILSDMGTYAHRMANMHLSEMHHREALSRFQSLPQPSFEHVYLSGNNMGAIMWFASKTDSALFFFDLALDALKHLEATPQNKHYRPAVLNNNMAAIYGLMGNTSKGIEAMTTAIAHLREYLSIGGELPKKEQAIQMQYEATDNLAGIYKELGDYSRARQLLLQSYREKKINLGKSNPDVFKSEVLLGQLYFAMREYADAETFLTRSLKNFETADGDFLFWRADAYNTLALLNDHLKDSAKADECYRIAEELYEQSLQGDYDNIYLEFLTNAALFYAETGRPDIALAKANKTFNYVIKTQGAETLSGFYQFLSLSSIYSEAGKYRESLTYSRRALIILNKLVKNAANPLDSIKIQLRKPKALLLETNAEYELLTAKTVQTLTPLRLKLDSALAILDQRKTILSDAGDIAILLNDHDELLSFIKKITLELYELTGSDAYANSLINIHESGIYNRIRARLGRSDSLQFRSLPKEIAAQEQKLRKSLAEWLNGDLHHADKMHAFVRLNTQWNSHLQMLAAKYPAYYKMRYGTIVSSIEQNLQSIPSNTTVIRYLFVDKKLFALVTGNGNRKLLPLGEHDLDATIAAISGNSIPEREMLESLYKLCQKLWTPLTRYVTNKKVIIVPDGILHHLNFELLTPSKVAGFKDLATSSLLASHTISYQYSLALIHPEFEKAAIDINYVGFAPGFTDELKSIYRQHSKSPDDGYISLLPQPFTVELALRTATLFDGSTYTHAQSTAAMFREKAGRHKIIHIGTHAESNNIHPEFSRLIFAKDEQSWTSDNSLYLFDIYGCDLTSEITVLTACETGKAGYKDGEGMISLAHAFNYAGSRSILTGLWKIDEKASAEIIAAFYANLRKGVDKDEALRLAKLNYLTSAHGRAVAPQYWAGLILMGDTSPLSIRKANPAFYLVPAALLLVSAAVFFFYKRARK